MDFAFGAVPGASVVPTPPLASAKPEFEILEIGVDQLEPNLTVDFVFLAQVDETFKTFLPKSHTNALDQLNAPK